MAEQKVKNSSRLLTSIKIIPLLILISLGAFIAIFSFLLVNQYFQQDEWHSFGLIQSYGLKYLDMDKPIWISFLSDRIGARSIMYLLFNVFNVNSIPYGVFALTIHLLNSLLLFIFAFKITRNRLIAFASSVFFLVNSVSDQAYSWFGTMAGSATSVVFVLLSLIFYFNFLEKKRYWYNLLSIVLLWFSFLFKEVGYFLFIAYPILWFIYIKNKTLKLFVKDNLLIFIYGIIMTVFFVQSILFIPGERANYIVPQTSGFIKVIQHLIFYPLEGISQILLPPPLIFDLAKFLTPLVRPSLQPDTPLFDLFYTTSMAEYVSVIASAIIIVLLFIIYKKYIRRTDKKIKFLFISSVLLMILSFLPYVVLDKFDAYLDSRYYYSVLMGASVVVGVLVYTSLHLIKETNKRRSLILFFITLFVYHAIVLVGNLHKQYIISSERVDIINQVKEIIPILPEKTVFFVTGNNSGFYALPELKVPFQSGFGQVLMTIYAPNNPVYPLLFKEKTFSKAADNGGFLYDTLAQGYREINRVGFGYYYDRKLLKKALNDKLFNENFVIWLDYNTDTKKMERKTMDRFSF